MLKFIQKYFSLKIIFSNLVLDFGTLKILVGTGVLTVKTLLGHSQITSTMVYCNDSMKLVDDNTKKLQLFRNGKVSKLIIFKIFDFRIRLNVSCFFASSQQNIDQMKPKELKQLLSRQRKLMKTELIINEKLSEVQQEINTLMLR